MSRELTGEFFSARVMNVIETRRARLRDATNREILDGKLTRYLRQIAYPLSADHTDNWQVYEINDGIYRVDAPGDTSSQFRLDGAKYTYFIDLNRRVSNRGLIRLGADLKKQGLGKALVRAREAFCKQLNVETVLISNCTNPSFWEHMGYFPVSPEEELAYRDAEIEIHEEAYHKHL